MKYFLQGLFDLSFDRFTSKAIAQVISIIGWLAALGWLMSLTSAMSEPQLALFIIIAPILFLVIAAVLRFTLEMYVALVRIAENTTKLVEMKESKKPYR